MEEHIRYEQIIQTSSKKEQRKSYELINSCIKNIKNVDLLSDDIQAAKEHGEAQRLLKLEKESLKNSKGIFLKRKNIHYYIRDKKM